MAAFSRYLQMVSTREDSYALRKARFDIHIHTYSFNNQLTRASDTIKSKMIKQMKIMNSIK